MNKENYWALILGGSSGLGLASANRLASIGYHLCIVHRDRKSDLPEFEKYIKSWKATGIEVKTFNRDALKNETIDDVIKYLPKKSIKVLVHSIAKGSLKSLQQITLQDFEITLRAMALSWWQWTQTLLQNQLFTADARNIAFTSEGSTKPWEGYGAVSLAKAALETLMKQMALEYAPYGIKTNCIQAGVTNTKSFKMIPNSDLLEKQAIKRNPFKKLTTPTDVANAVGLLVTEEANWINGTIIKVDGGESLK